MRKGQLRTTHATAPRFFTFNLSSRSHSIAMISARRTQPPIPWCVETHAWRAATTRRRDGQGDTITSIRGNKLEIGKRSARRSPGRPLLHKSLTYECGGMGMVAGATWLQVRHALPGTTLVPQLVDFAPRHDLRVSTLVQPFLLRSAAQRNWTASREANDLPHDLGSRNRKECRFVPGTGYRVPVQYRVPCSPEFAETASRAFGSHFLCPESPSVCWLLLGCSITTDRQSPPPLLPSASTALLDSLQRWLCCHRCNSCL